MTDQTTLNSGHFYTMSKLKHPCGDRSYTHDIWEVLETNGAHAVIKAITAKPGSVSFGYEPLIVLVEEFDWTPAENLAKAYTDHCISEE